MQEGPDLPRYARRFDQTYDVGNRYVAVVHGEASIDRNLELIGHIFQERQGGQAGLGTELIERDDRVIVEHQIAAHVVLEAPG